MSRNNSRQTFDPNRSIKKFFLSGFVVFTFIVYAIHERLTNSSSAQSSTPTNSNSTTAQGAVAASNQSAASYKDGSYTGPQVDAYYGYVEVKADIQHGKIASVQFLEYPNDRRTSVRINTTVMPWLQDEAIQAQSANVDVISGATFTSQAFRMSLQSALNSARN